MPAPPRSIISVSALSAELQASINRNPALQDRWVRAELTEVRGSGGHVFVELAEKDDKGEIKAKIRANIWRNTAIRMSRDYGDRMRQIMQVGSEVLVRGSVSYSPLYSLTFTITDIDPTYQRDTTALQAQILATLTAEGIAGANKELTMCEAPQRIAVISAPGAAGYGDFRNQLLSNPYRLRFAPTLFAATMQGASVSPTVRAALDSIEQRIDEYDCVVIIRGGGATTDLAGFDELQLARAVALFPLPVIVGIGHERDNTVLDFLAHTRVKTPTAAAEFLIARCADVLARVLNLSKYIASWSEKTLHGEHRQLEFYQDKIPSLSRLICTTARARLEQISTALPLLVQTRLGSASSTLANASRAIESVGQRRISSEQMRLQSFRASLERDLQVALQRESQRLHAISEKVEILSPQSTLARGYSITTIDGHAITDPAQAPPGATLTTRLLHGDISSTVDPLS